MTASVSPTALPKLVTDAGYEVIADQYREQELQFPQFCRRLNRLNSFPFGMRWVGGISDATPTLRAPGQELSIHSALEGYARQLAANEYSDAIGIPDEMLQGSDAQGAIVDMTQTFLQTFTRKAMAQKDQLAFDVLQKGTLAAGSAVNNNSFPGAPDSAPLFIYDGKPLFAASGNNHPIRNGSTTYYNLVVSAALSASTLDTAFTMNDSTNAVDESGTKIDIRSDLLIVPYGLRSTALQLVESEGQPGTAMNDINPNRGRAQVMVSRYLTDVDAWFLLERFRSLVYFDSGAPQITTWRDERRKVTMVGASYRFGVAVDDWRGASAHNKATS